MRAPPNYAMSALSVTTAIDRARCTLAQDIFGIYYTVSFFYKTVTSMLDFIVITYRGQNLTENG